MTPAPRYMESEESNPISDPADILAALFPALLKLAHRELEVSGQSEELAEDIAQAAGLYWFDLVTTEASALRYMRKAIKNQVAGLKRPRNKDVLDHNPLSLNQLEEE